MTCQGVLHDDARPLVAFDWSRNTLHVTWDGENVEQMNSVQDLLDRLAGVPHRIVTEATVESWDPDRKMAFATRARAEGHEILVYRPIHTARFRDRQTPPIRKNNVNDAKAIFGIAAEGRLHLYPLPAPDSDWAKRRQDLNEEFIRLRSAGDMGELVRSAQEVLGPYGDLAPTAQAALGNGTEYAEAMIAAVYFAAIHADSRAEFERFLGLHGSGYPSVLRSNVHHHGFRHRRNQGVSWTAFRRELRHAYAAIREARRALLPADVPPVLER